MDYQKRENLLTQEEIESIRDYVNEAFVKDGQGAIKLDYLILKKQVGEILQQLNTQIVIKNSLTKKNKNKTSYILANRQDQLIAAKGYGILFQVRAFLFQPMDYRLYYVTEEGKTHVAEVEEKDIFSFISLSNKRLELGNIEEIEKNMKKLQDYSIYEQYATRHYNTLMQSFHQAYTLEGKKMIGVWKNPFFTRRGKNKHNYFVRSVIMSMYGPTSSWNNTGLKSSNGKYQLFNRGHIFEGVDIATSQAILEEQFQNFNIVEQYTFGKYLVRDSIAALRGGDNPITNTSIKSNSASLQDYRSIQLQLQQLYDILNFKNFNDIKENIANLFLHKAKFNNDEQALQTAANDAADKIIQSMSQEILNKR